MERFRAKMAGPAAWRHSDRARTFLVLFSHRYLHCSKRCLEFAFFALLNFPALTSHNGHSGSQGPPGILRVPLCPSCEILP